jgi:nicotinamidase-related amidase
MQRAALGKLSVDNSVLLVCDIQERFRDIIWHFDCRSRAGPRAIPPAACRPSRGARADAAREAVVRVSKLLVDGASVMKLPVLATEQYPKALGATVGELGPVPRIPKMLFSMYTPEVKAHLATLGPRDNFLLCGLETHVCVLQTCLDLLEAGKTVHVVVDGVSSSRSLDRAVALRRMEAAGAIMTTAESTLFQLMGSANYPNFKSVSGLVKEYGKKPSELASL